MYYCRLNQVFTFVLVLSCLRVFGQTTTSGSNPLSGRENNPYSKYGIGELRNGNNAVLRGMGSITSAFANPYVANTDNPASYASLRRTTFEVGATGTNRIVHGTVNGADASYRTGSVSVAHMNLAMPVGKNGGLCFGFRPYSATYSRLEDTLHQGTTPASPLDTITRSYLANGGLNYAFIGGSAKYKGLSIGVNVGYLFGKFNNSDVVIPKSDSAIYNAFYAQFVTNNRIGGILWKAGLQYEIKVDSLHLLRIGGTVTLGQQMTEHFQEQHLAAYSFGDTVIRDTSYNSGELKGKLNLPLSYSGGIMFTRPGKWSIGVDYSATQWSGFSSQYAPGMNVSIAASSFKASVGGEYTPGAENSRRYLSRATYRLGASMGNDYLQLAGLQLPFYNVTAGFSMPFRRSLSQLHTAVEVGALGTTDNGLMRQNYVRVTLGLSLNDLWFIRPKYN